MAERDCGISLAAAFTRGFFAGVIATLITAGTNL